MNHCSCARTPYGLLNFIADGTMTIITGGYWLIWVFVREMRGQRR